MNVTLYLIVGGIVGLLLTILIQMKGLPNYVLNISLGVVGAFIAGWIFTPLYGISTLDPSYFSTSALAVALIGAVILVAAVNFLRWGTRRHLPWRE